MQINGKNVERLLKLSHCLFYMVFLNQIPIPVGSQIKDSIRFVTTQVITEVSKARAISIGDFNIDGKDDVALGVWGPSFSDGNRLRVYFQNPQNKIENNPTLYDTLLFASDMQVIDVDQDGKKELVVADQFGEGIVIYRQTSPGKLQKSIVTNSMTGCLSIRVADLNNDHRLDIATTRVFHGVQDSFHVYYQGTNGEFESSITYPLEKSFHLGGDEYTWSNIQAADFNSDGLTDLLISGGKFTNQVSIYLQQATGELTFERHFEFDSYLRNVAVGDFSGDGRIDFAACRFFVDFTIGSQIGLFVQDSTGKYPDVPEYYPAYDRPITIFSKDLDMDGKLDLLLSHDNRYDLTCYRQTDTGRFEPFIKIPSGNRDAFLQASIAFGDINSDGMPDIASISSLGELYIMVNETKNDGNTYIKNINSIPPTSYSLSQNYPNPFNGETTIQYNIPYKSKIAINIYDMLGREQSEIINTDQSPGAYAVHLKPDMSSGIYLYRLVAQPFDDPGKIIILTKKMQLLK